MGALCVFSAAIFAVIARGSISGGLVGLSISYALQVLTLNVMRIQQHQGKCLERLKTLECLKMQINPRSRVV